jgi:hypothetical protein
VTCINGDSGGVLAQVVAGLEEPALFWLDAHTSGGNTADAGRDTIEEELRTIFAGGERDRVDRRCPRPSHRPHRGERAAEPSIGRAQRYRQDNAEVMKNPGRHAVRGDCDPRVSRYFSP